MSDYCNLCDFDPCVCGQHGKVQAIPNKSTVTRTGAGGMDDPIRELVLTAYEEGVRENWQGWLNRIVERFGDSTEYDLLRGTWNRVSNELQRRWLLIEDPNGDGPMMSPANYPNARRLTLDEAKGEVGRLIQTGKWTAGAKGLKMWQVWKLVGDAVYTDIQEALHDLKDRGELVETRSVYWYVKKD